MSEDILGRRPERISIYIYPWMQRKVEEISEKRGKRKRHIYMEALQQYIRLYEEGMV